jgi:hypothetical protein
MNTNILVTASALSDRDLLARLEGLAGNEREAAAELVAHLAALDSRPSLFAAQGYGSLFGYCTQALRLSEDAACNRIDAARACRRFPAILDLLASGSLSLTSVRLLAKHLTAENHQSVLARAKHRTRREIEALVAELAPRPDLPSTVRRLPCFRATPSLPEGQCPGRAAGPASGHAPAPGPGPAMTSEPCASATTIAPSPSALPATPRPIVQASAPERYRVQFTIGKETHEKLRRLQALLRREIPDGDPGAIFGRALTVLLERVERTKLAAAAKPRPNRPVGPKTGPSPAVGPETDPNPPVVPVADPKPPIRPGTDTEVRKPGMPSLPPAPLVPLSRTVPREVKREVWRRDAGQCAFVSSTGRRCAESTFLEFHHVRPYAMRGPATLANISLRCRRHNQYEAEMIFGPYGASIVRETRESFDLAPSGPVTTIDR